MGLAERRAVKAFQDDKYPQIAQEINAVAGYEVPVEVMWDTLGAEGYSDLYSEAFPKVYFKPLIEALKAICIDDMGKEALRSGLKKIVICDTGTKEISFTNGVLTINHSSISNLDYWGERKTEIQQVLERGL